MVESKRCTDCGMKITTVFTSGSPPKPRCLKCDSQFTRRRYWARQEKKEKSIIAQLEDEKKNRDEKQTRISDCQRGVQ